MNLSPSVVGMCITLKVLQNLSTYLLTTLFCLIYQAILSNYYYKLCLTKGLHYYRLTSICGCGTIVVFYGMVNRFLQQKERSYG